METVMEKDIDKTKPSGHRKLLILSLFKNSSRWIRDILDCFKDVYYFNDKLDDNDEEKLKINISFCDGESTDRTYEILDTYRVRNPVLNIQLRKYDVQNLGDKNDKFIRFKKLAKVRNYIIDASIKEFPLDDNDLILFADSDIKFEKDIVHELIKDMNMYRADIIAPMIYIEDFGRFKNSYFYDILAFRDRQGNKFEHFQPYIPEFIKMIKQINIGKLGKDVVHGPTTNIRDIKDIYMSGVRHGINMVTPMIYTEDFERFKNSYINDMPALTDSNKFEHLQSAIQFDILELINKMRIDRLSELRRINREMNLNSLDSPLDTEVDTDRCEMSEVADINIPVEIGSAGSFYLMKYKVAKNIKYTGEKDSEQVEFMKSAYNEKYKIFVSPRLGVLHINLNKYGMKWH